MIFFLYSLLISISYGTPDWDENPVAAFMYTEADEVDRNGDGRIDLWIERDEKKRIRKLSFDSTYQFGKPVLRFHLDHLGNVIEREEVMLDANNKMLSAIHATIQNNGKNSKSLSISHRDSKKELYREEWEILKNQTLRQTISQNIRQIEFDSSLAGAFDVDGFLANPATVCLGRSSSSRLTTTSVGKLMAQVDPATEVHSSCNNFRLVGNDGSADKGTALPPATIKSRLTGIINTGVQCMRNLKAADGTTPAHTPNRMADELLANVYARANNESAKKLNIRCDRPAARVNEAGYANNVMATTSNFADPEFPSIFLNRLLTAIP